MDVTELHKNSRTLQYNWPDLDIAVGPRVSFQMYSPNKYYQPYTAASDRRRGSVSSEDNSPAEGEVRDLTSHRRTNCRCCCVIAVLTVISIATVTGILVWVLNREAIAKTIGTADRDVSSDLSSLLDSHISTTTTRSTSTTITTSTSTSKLKSDNIIFPTKKPNEGFHETENIQATTQTSRSTTSENLETRYTEIITKMKQMRQKNRLSSKRNFAVASTTPATNYDFLEISTKPSKFHKNDSSPIISGSVNDKNVDTDNENKREELENKNKLKVVKTEQVIKANITGTEDPDRQPDVQDENVKLSKALIFDDELTASGTVQIRNERNQAKTVKLNNLHSDLLEKVVEQSDLDIKTIVKSVTVDNVIPTTTIKLTSSRATPTSSQKFFVYPQVPALKTYTVDTGADTFCK